MIFWGLKKNMWSKSRKHVLLTYFQLPSQNKSGKKTRIDASSETAVNGTLTHVPDLLKAAISLWFPS